MASVSLSSPKRMAWVYTSKVAVLAGVAGYLGALASSLVIGLILKWDYWVPLLVALGGACGGAIGVAVVTYRAYRNLLDVNYDGTSGVDQVRDTVLNVSYPAAFQLCLDSLTVFNNSRVLLANPRQGRIEAALVPEPFWKTFTSNGSRISFRLGSDQEGATHVTVASKAPLRTAKIDFDFNNKNVSRIIAFFQSSGQQFGQQ